MDTVNLDSLKSQAMKAYKAGANVENPKDADIELAGVAIRQLRRIKRLKDTLEKQVKDAAKLQAAGF